MHGAAQMRHCSAVSSHFAAAAAASVGCVSCSGLTECIAFLCCISVGGHDFEPVTSAVLPEAVRAALEHRVPEEEQEQQQQQDYYFESFKKAVYIVEEVGGVSAAAAAASCQQLERTVAASLVSPTTGVLLLTLWLCHSSLTRTPVLGLLSFVCVQGAQELRKRRRRDERDIERLRNLAAAQDQQKQQQEQQQEQPTAV